MNINNLTYQRFGVSIWRAKFKTGGDKTLLYSNKGFTFDQFIKWQWYFDYKSALFKLLTPKEFILVETFKYEQLPQKEVLIKDCKNQIKALKASVTKINNALNKFMSSGYDLFPGENPHYQKALKKLERKKHLLKQKEEELRNLKL